MMKKTILGLIMIVTIMLSNLVNAQSNYVGLGTDAKNVEAVIKILVLDNENSQPISGAVIKMMKNSNRIFQIATDYNGIAVIVIRKQDYYYDRERNSGTLTVRDNNYRYDYWERNFEIDDYSEYETRRQFVIEEAIRNQEFWFNPGDIKNYEIYKKITNEDYKSHEKGKALYSSYGGRTYVGVGTPGLFEITVRLNYKRHSRDVQSYSNSDREYRNSNSNSGGSGIYIKRFDVTFPSLPTEYSIHQNNQDGISFISDYYQIMIHEDRGYYTVTVYSTSTGSNVTEVSWMTSLDEARDVMYDYMRRY